MAMTGFVIGRSKFIVTVPRFAQVLQEFAAAFAHPR